MALKTYRFASHKEMDTFLRGGISAGAKIKLAVSPGPGAPNSATKLAVQGLHNKTLVFTTPAKTVTFADASGAGLSLKEILAQINTGLGAGYTARFDDSLLIIEDDDASGPVVLTGATSTAASVFGFPPVTVSGVVYAPPDGVAPRLLMHAPDNKMDGIIATVEE